MKRLIVALALIWLFLPLNIRVGFAASVTLNSGQVVEGKIVSETDAEIRLEIVNETHTITSTSVIPKSNVKSVMRDTPEQKAEQTAYFALDKYKLHPSQELAAVQYKQGIDAFEKFLTDYPKSTHAEEVRAKLAEWKAEAANLQSGKVKFANKWMIPEEKKLRSLQKQLADLQTQRDSVADVVAKVEGQLAGLQTKLQTLPSHVEVDAHVWHTYPTGPGTVQTLDTVERKNVPNPEVTDTQNKIISCQQAIASGRTKLPTLDAKIQTIQVELPGAQSAYEVALANTSAASAPVVVAQPTPLPFPKP